MEPFGDIVMFCVSSPRAQLIFPFDGAEQPGTLILLLWLNL